MKLIQVCGAIAMMIRASLAADDDFSLVGTWSSKSNTVFTGPGFYDPVDELLIEPALPGIAYSFTEDGYFEEAIYQVQSNPRNHSCPTAVMIYQHGTYQELSNGSLLLEPFDVDGRQLLSQPCEDGGVSTYTRYNQTEVFRNYELSVDQYHGRYKLQMYAWDGAKQQPLYLAYRPPMMLPTQTMNPTDSAQQTGTSTSQRVKRSLENRFKTNAVKKQSFDYDFWQSVSIASMVIGGILYIAC